MFLAKRIFFILIILILLACLLVQGCGSPPEEPVKVGIILPITGPHVLFGEIEKLSFEMAVDEINSRGGVRGRKIRLIFGDDMSSAEQCCDVVDRLIDVEKVVIIGGGYSSSVTFELARRMVERRFPFLVNTASADKITEPAAYTESGLKAARLRKSVGSVTDSEKYEEIQKTIEELERSAEAEAGKIRKGFPVFRLNPPVSEYASGLEGFLARVVKPETAVILHENSLFGTKGASAFEKTCRKLGIKLLLNEGYDGGLDDFRPILARVKKINPDLIYMVSYINDAVLLMRQSMELEMDPKLFVGAAAGFTLPEFYRKAGKAAEKVFSATLWHESLSIPYARDYFTRFVAKYGKPTEYHGAEAYAAMYVIADVLNRAKSLKPEDIIKALSETNMMTVFGPVKFESYGRKVNQNRASTYVVQWINGVLEIIWPRNLASARYVYPVNWIEERR
jgi:branched-chain amino acid transport system substrate-binding protein